MLRVVNVRGRSTVGWICPMAVSVLEIKRCCSSKFINYDPHRDRPSRDIRPGIRAECATDRDTSAERAASNLESVRSTQPARPRL